MRRALSHGGPMAPAARALLICGFGNRSAQFLAWLQRQIAQDKKFLQLVFWNRRDDRFVAGQRDRGLERVTDQLFLARTLDGLADHAAPVQELLDSFARLRVTKLRLFVRKRFDVDGIRVAELTPRFFRGENQD